MGGVGAAVGNAIQSTGSAIGNGAKALYGDEKNMIQTGQPQEQGQDPTMAQRLLFGQQQQGPTPAQRNRQMQLGY